LFILRPRNSSAGYVAINTFELLARCARLYADDSFYHNLARDTAHFSAWDALITQAETHGLGPLAYTHLHAAGAVVPRPAKRALQGLYLRHRHANQVRAQVLAELLNAFRQAGIEVLLLKGIALAHLVYPQPGLRPMRDMDLLVSRAQAREAQALLAGLGFDAPLPGNQLPAKHLTVAQRQTEGLTVSIEIHHNLHSEGSPDTSLEALRPAAMPLTINGEPAYTLGAEALLDHLYRHLRVNILLDDLRLIWLTDLINLAAKFAAKIDWARVDRRLKPALAACQELIPLPPPLLDAAAINPNHPPADFGVAVQGWPRHSLAALRHKSYAQIWHNSYFPPEWWLRLYYGAGPGRSLAWHRWLVHPVNVSKMALQTIATQSR
jgi:hypothetical protein